MFRASIACRGEGIVKAATEEIVGPSGYPFRTLCINSDRSDKNQPISASETLGVTFRKGTVHGESVMLPEQRKGIKKPVY